MHPDDRHTIAEYRHTVKTGEPYSAFYRMQGLDGRMRWFRDDAAAVRDETGTPRFIQGVIFDVTKQKQAEGGPGLRGALPRDARERPPGRGRHRPRGPHHVLQRVPGRALRLVGG